MRIEYDKDGKAKIVRCEKKDEADITKKTPNKFYDIPYLQARYLDTFQSNEIVWIEEKLDGTNVSCEVDEHGNYRCYGRRYELGEWYTNRGAYQKLLELENKIREVVGDKYVVYFEYLVEHHIKYSEDKMNKIYIIGAREKNHGAYLTPDKVYELADKLDVDKPECLYHGPFKDWSIAESLVGKTVLGAKSGEGVIVKAYDINRGIKMVKIVADEFREVMKHDPAKAQEKMESELAKREKAKEIVTDARIRKQLLNMVDEGIIPSLNGLSKEEKTTAIKNIGRRVYDDCIKEESDFVIEFGKDFGKYSFLLSKQFIENLD